ncbi:acetyl-coenzyme A transporter [Acrasis kona]|uniref:Acetyl-coenzyme A transporter n=1 Tax=Acrasis kona TaxID=1008807 RepID=A0AAW2ZPV8_9EUKA
MRKSDTTADRQNVKDPLLKIEETLNHVKENFEETITDVQEKIEQSFTETKKQVKKTAKTYINDIPSFALLIALYAIQGLSLALVTNTIPFILQNKLNVVEFGILSLSVYPYGLKLLWAPLIDTFYIGRIGRRKSWIVASQLLCSILLLTMSFNAERLFSKHNAPIITLVITMLSILLSIQDSAIDGWTINLFHDVDIGYSALCQTIGFAAGFAVSYNGFLSLQQSGWLSFSTFLFMLSLLYLASPIALLLLVKEKQQDNDLEMIRLHNKKSTVAHAYQQIARIIKLPHVTEVLITFLVFGISFSISDSLGPVKLSYRGFEATSLLRLAPYGVPLAAATFVGTAYMASKIPPFKLWKGAFTLKLIFVGLMLLLAFAFPYIDSMDQLPALHTNLFLLVGCTYLMIGKFMGAAQTAMLINVSDAKYGATYMALFKTVLDFGNNVVGRVIHFIIESLTMKACNCESIDGSGDNAGMSVQQRVEACPPEQLKCRATVDGLLIVGGVCFVAGIVMLSFFGSRMRVLDKLNEKIWEFEGENEQELADASSTHKKKVLTATGKIRVD